MPHFYLLLVWLLGVGWLGAQTDSLPPVLQRLTVADLRPAADSVARGQVLSGSRFLQDGANLPFTIHVVTREEIQRNNYVTLGDLLRNVPGALVSQPGTAEVGESFTLRGLGGNQYVTVLVNDLPIKPANLRGLPIGAQWPLRQAERVEIVYGPAAPLYGADAAAAVINIILQQTERPAYASADLQVGALGFTDINVSFGGKIGNDRGLRYRLYGANTRYNDRPLDLEASPAFDPVNYDVDETSLLQNPNFVPQIDSTIQPFVGALPHLSHQLGVDLQWRGWQLSLGRHYRRDHSALGRQPTSVSYADDGAFTAETINRFALSYRREGKLLEWRVLGNVLDYQLDPQSSTIFIESELVQDIQTFATLTAGGDLALLDSLSSAIFRRFFSGRRYSYARGSSVRVEPLVLVRPRSWLHLSLGSMGQVIQDDYQDFRQRPFDPNNPNNINNDFDQPFRYFNSQGELNLFGQAMAQGRYGALVAGWRRYWPEFGSGQDTWRLGGQLRLGARWRLRAASGMALGVPSLSLFHDTYLLFTSQTPDAYRRFQPGLLGSPGAERHRQSEVGLHGTLGAHWEVDVVHYRQRSEDLLTRSRTPDVGQGDDLAALTAYLNLGAAASWQGWQVSWYRRQLGRRGEGYCALHAHHARGRETLPEGLGELPYVRELPRWMVQANGYWRISAGMYLQTNLQYVSGNYLRGADDPDAGGARNLFTYQSGYFLLDLIGHLSITDNVRLVGKALNATNAAYGGLSGYRGDNLFLNPQLGRRIFLGLTYQMN